jgi:hypothetical protein
MVGLKFKLPLLNLKLVQINAWISIEYAHPSYADTIFQMSFTHHVKPKQKFDDQILHQCGISSLCG